MPLTEAKLLFLIAAVQCVNILDFMMVMPLGPDMAKGLTMPMEMLGWIGGSYTAAASIAGLITSSFLDQLDRRTALHWSLIGLFIATLLGGCAVDFTTLLMTRVLAGCFGGPASAVALAMVADVIPPERRGQALGKVMGSFSVAAVVGVPIGLALSEWHGWRMPFFAVAALGLLVLCMSYLWLPSFASHKISGKKALQLNVIWTMLSNRLYLLGFLVNGCAMMAGFLIIPHLSTYFQYNLGYPRESLGLLYMAGGAVTFVAMRVTGRLIDQTSATVAGWIAALCISMVLYGGFIEVHPFFAPLWLFMSFMFGMSIRNIAMHTLASKVPLPEERAGFMALLSSVQHMASACGAFLSSHLLKEAPDKSLLHMDNVAWISFCLTWSVLFLMWRVERGVRRRHMPVVTEESLESPVL